MTTLARPRLHERVNTRLRARILCGDRTYAAVVVSLAETGFSAEGRDLDDVAPSFVLEVELESAGQPTWSPKARRGSVDCTPAPLRAECRLLYLDLGRRAGSGDPITGLGASFESLSPVASLALQDYLGQLLLTRERRPRGGAVPRPPEVSGVGSLRYPN